MKILIVDSSVREARATPRVVKWVEKAASQVADVEFETVDLKSLALPMFNEPILPMMNPDRKPEGNLKVWLDGLDSADGYVFVTPEYNHGVPSGLKNAIDYINFQIMKKPFLVVSHGANGGARSAEQLKQILNANIGAVPVPSGVALNGMIGFHEMISEDGEILADSLKHEQKGLDDKLAELVWFAGALKAGRS